RHAEAVLPVFERPDVAGSALRPRMAALVEGLRAADAPGVAQRAGRRDRMGRGRSAVSGERTELGCDAVAQIARGEPGRIATRDHEVVAAGCEPAAERRVHGRVRWKAAAGAAAGDDASDQFEHGGRNALGEVSGTRARAAVRGCARAERGRAVVETDAAATAGGRAVAADRAAREQHYRASAFTADRAAAGAGRIRDPVRIERARAHVEQARIVD